MTESVENPWVMLLGRRDVPTDGVRDYCAYLADGLARCGIRTTMVEVPWVERGWIRSMTELWGLGEKWKGHWVLAQYTALSWSRRGFPFGVVAVLATLRLRGARTAVVFHDWTGYTGPRWLDWIRWRCQCSAMRCIAGLADRSVLPVPPERAAWLGGAKKKAVFIPIGANLPDSLPAATPNGGQANSDDRPRHCPTVSVFGVTEGEPGIQEATAIASVVKSIAAPLDGLRLVVFGRGSEQSRPVFEQALRGSGVELSVLGLLPPEEVAEQLSRADAALFVRGEIVGHRGSAIAGIVCGIPVIGYGNPERAFPLSEAGVVLVQPGDDNALAERLTRVLRDDALRRSLREKSRRAQAEYFSWLRIAQRFTEALADD